MSVTFHARFNHLDPKEWILFLIFCMSEAHMKETKVFFSYGDAQIDEMSPIIIDTNVEDLRYVTESSHIAIPSIKLTFIPPP